MVLRCWCLSDWHTGSQGEKRQKWAGSLIHIFVERWRWSVSAEFCLMGTQAHRERGGKNLQDSNSYFCCCPGWGCQAHQGVQLVSPWNPPAEKSAAITRDGAEVAITTGNCSLGRPGPGQGWQHHESHLSTDSLLAACGTLTTVVCSAAVHGGLLHDLSLCSYPDFSRFW